MLRLVTVRVWSLEALCRYIARPPLAKSRLVDDGGGEYRVLLKTPWSDGTSSIQLTKWELMEMERSGVGESPNIVRNRMAVDCVDSTATFAPGFVSWCVFEQCEVPKAGPAQIS